MLDRAVFRFSIDALVIILGAPSVRGLALPDAAEPSPSRASLNGLDGIIFSMPLYWLVSVRMWPFIWPSRNGRRRTLVSSWLRAVSLACLPLYPAATC